jgi:hypothetical protein
VVLSISQISKGNPKQLQVGQIPIISAANFDGFGNHIRTVDSLRRQNNAGSLPVYFGRFITSSFYGVIVINLQQTAMGIKKAPDAYPVIRMITARGHGYGFPGKVPGKGPALIFLSVLSTW